MTCCTDIRVRRDRGQSFSRYGRSTRNYGRPGGGWALSSWFFAAAIPVLTMTLGCAGCSRPTSGEKAPPGQRTVLYVFAGAAGQPAISEAAAEFERRTGIEVRCTFGGSGTVLNQVRIERMGDVYIPGSDQYMDAAVREGIVDADTVRTIAELRPALLAPARDRPDAGHPEIKGLADLARPGVRVVIGDPGSVCLGQIAQSILRARGIYERVRPNIISFAADCQQIVNLTRLGEADAAIGYDVFARQAPGIRIVRLLKVGGAPVTIPAGVIRFTGERAAAMQFVRFISGPVGRGIFARHGYSIPEPEVKAGATGGNTP